MKRFTTCLLAIYFIWGAISLFIPAGGSMWPVHAPLAVTALLYLILEEKRSKRIIGALLLSAAVAILIVDLCEGAKYKEKILRVRHEAMIERAEQGVAPYGAQGAAGER